MYIIPTARRCRAAPTLPAPVQVSRRVEQGLYGLPVTHARPAEDISPGWPSALISAVSWHYPLLRQLGLRPDRAPAPVELIWLPGLSRTSLGGSCSVSRRAPAHMPVFDLRRLSCPPKLLRAADICG